ncbi:triose-phosphate isomerase [Flavobacteriaceae bacterium]|nr:triose-phosphate isomerase [Flavobacteriaceae bacterium]
MGNWKLHGSLDAIDQFANTWRGLALSPSVEVVICVPAPYFLHVRQQLPELGLGAQDCSAHESGAFTGEMSAQMLFDVGCRWVIVGHSERRLYHDETDSQVAAKASVAQKAGLHSVVCCGETLAQRQSGQQFAVVEAQLKASLASVALDKLIIAYEPVWAIGTGLVASPKQAEEMHLAIRGWLTELYGTEGISVPLLYGGSVKAESAGDLFACDNIDGALVGGASLEAESLAGIVEAA